MSSPKTPMSKRADAASHLLLGLALIAFFISPAYMDYVSFAVIKLPGKIPCSGRPLLLLACLSFWCAVHSSSLGLFLGRCMAFLPVLYILSIPHMLDMLARPLLFLAALSMWVASLAVLARVSPSLQGLTMQRKLGFVAMGLLSFFGFLWLFLIMAVHVDPFPLGLTLWGVLLLLAAWAWVAGQAGSKRHLRFWAPVWVVITACWLLKGVSEPRPSAAGFLIEPYLQNLQPQGITILWETPSESPGQVLVAEQADIVAAAVKRGPTPTEWQTLRLLRIVSPASRIHEVPVTGLTENTVYHYAVVPKEGDPVFGSFRTAYQGPDPFEFGVMADSSRIFGWVDWLIQPKHQRVCDSIRKFSPDVRFMVHIGDRTFFGNEYPRWKKEYFDPARELIHNLVVWHAVGNHEKDAEWYFKYFSMPNEDEHYYSFNYGQAHFVVLAVEGYASGHTYGPPKKTPLEPGSPQYEWLRNDLEANLDKRWRLVFFHHSPLSIGVEGNYLPVMEHWVPLFDAYGVDAVFCGHDHDYELSVLNDRPYVVTGGAGSFTEPCRLQARHNPYSRYFRPVWHHCNVRVEPDRLLVRAIDLKGRTFHHFVVDKSSGKRIIREDQAP